MRPSEGGSPGRLDAAVVEAVLNYVRAFTYHDKPVTRFVGILRTNAVLAQVVRQTEGGPA
jgi:hypothetical protein